ncbi:hypothetical protein BD309DRAFT_869286 [Dichomitus squalens]|uniref:Uncharacterized protein n=2 Tax=Dichomitus squalens TaxID=114155 RepID=A0A4Q9PFI4_9APHY|nr:uncharacterized protein DICSQDRAFT_155966 [Dichomitus squalens LYAD-421 SS1]EJF59992.1 hypothetical protein DICSQDRAFT_155966 [Dichomitus squalens LYAD-421 SS1]TBU40943.1 hypothetical protein BD309DRAFT_869286 [Dichomitus squalens]TBU51937.1 hypothetical protein BD310DRAFT_833282 [Dichomitus squalens]
MFPSNIHVIQDCPVTGGEQALARTTGSDDDHAPTSQKRSLGLIHHGIMRATRLVRAQPPGNWPPAPQARRASLSDMGVP